MVRYSTVAFLQLRALPTNTMLSHLAVPGRRASAALARSPVLALRSPRSILASAEVRRGAHLLAAAHRTGPRFLVPPRRVAAHRVAQLMEVQFRPVFRRAAPLHGMLFSSAARSAARTTRTTARGVALSSKTTFTHPLDFPCYFVWVPSKDGKMTGRSGKGMVLDPPDRFATTMRLCFAWLTDAQIVEGVQFLANQ